MKYLALTIPGNDGPLTINPPGSTNLPLYADRYLLLNNFLTLSLSLISIVAIGFIIWGGIQIILSEGDKQKMQAARGKVTYAVIGLIIAFISFFIIQVVGAIFGVELLTIDL